MTSKTKGNFNSGNKQVYKYNIVKKPSETIEPLSLLNSIKMNADSLNGRIEEYYYLIIKLDNKRTLHRLQFTIKDEEEIKVDE